MKRELLQAICNASRSRAKIFGENLENIIKERGFTRKEFAEKLNITTTAIGNYISGNREPSFDKVFEMAEILKVSIVSLFGDTQYNLSPKIIENRILGERLARSLAILAYAHITVMENEDDEGYIIEIPSIVKRVDNDGKISYITNVEIYKLKDNLSLINVVENSERDALTKNETFLDNFRKNFKTNANA